MNDLIIDIGNTLVKLAVFKQDLLIQKVAFSQQEEMPIFDWITNQSVQNIIISDVSHAQAQSWIQDLNPQGSIVWFDEHTLLPISNGYQTPATLGKDRLAAVAGAHVQFPNNHCLVIDAGTCITYDFIDANGHFWGGSITPGLKMRFRAMHEYTGRLPLLDLMETEEVVGQSTEMAMQTGVQLGLMHEINGFFDTFSQYWRNIKLILTGGDAIFLAEKLKKEIFVNQNLVLEGLNQILKHHVEASQL